MKRIFAFTTTLLLTLWASGSAWAFVHANSWGGATMHGFGFTAHESAFGTSTTHVAGLGTEHTDIYGGSTARGYYGGAIHTTPYGDVAYRPPDGYYGYHPPTTVNYYGAHCYDCGWGWATAGAAAAGAAVGATVGAAAASSYGQVMATLPAGCVAQEVAGGTYYACGNTWFRPAFGANGVYYTVVPAP